MFNHHDRNRPEPLTEAEREQLLRDGAVAKGPVMQSEQSDADRGRSQVRVQVDFSGGQSVQFIEGLANLYQPAPGSPEAQRLAKVRSARQLRHPDRVPKIQLPLSDGERVPVRYDAGHRDRIALDVPALQQRALRDYIEREQRQQTPAAAPAAKGAAGPPADGARPLPELRRAGRPGEGLQGRRPAVPVLRPADPGRPARALGTMAEWRP